MGLVNKIKQLFKRGQYVAQGHYKLNKISDHPLINDKAAVRAVFKDSERRYRGEYSAVKFKTTTRKTATRSFNGLNITKQAAEYLSNLVIGEGVKINLANKDAEEFILSVFERSGVNTNLKKIVEAAAALGNAVIKVGFDGDFNLSVAYSTNIYPITDEFDNLSGVVIAYKTTRTENKKRIHYTLLEVHTETPNEYVTTNELYRSDTEGVAGNRVALSVLYPNLQEVVRYSKETFTVPPYVILKAAGTNNVDLNSSLAVGITANARGILDTIDQTFDQFNQEIKRSKKRVVISDHFLRADINGQDVNRYFDEDEDTFLALPAGIDDFTFNELSSDIRVDEYTTALNKMFRLLEGQVGLSGGTFNFDESKGLKTATEVVSEQSATFRTRAANIDNVRYALQQLAVWVTELGKVYGLYQGLPISTKDVGIDFDDGLLTDKNDQLDYYQKAMAAGVIPKTIVIQRLFGLDVEEAQNWLKLINAEDFAADPVLQLTREQTEDEE